jgi:hypothetical protein
MAVTVRAGGLELRRRNGNSAGKKRELRAIVSSMGSAALGAEYVAASTAERPDSYLGTK